MNLRDDLQLIYDWIPEGSRVLDLGCGDGELLAALVEHKKCSGYGIEIDTDSVITAMSRGVNVIQADLEQGLAEFGDQTFDVIVLSQTIQAMQNPALPHARGKTGDCQLPEFRLLAQPLPNRYRRAYAGFRAHALPLVRHAEHPLVYAQRL